MPELASLLHAASDWVVFVFYEHGRIGQLILAIALILGLLGAFKLLGRVLGTIVTFVVRRILKKPMFSVASIQPFRLTAKLIFLDLGNVTIGVSRVSISTSLLRYLLSFGSTRLLTVRVSGLNIAIRAPSKKSNSASVAAANVSTDQVQARGNRDDDAAGPSDSSAQQETKAIPFFGLVTRFLGSFSFQLSDLNISVSAPSCPRRLHLSLSNLTVTVDRLRSLDSGNLQFIPRLSIDAINLAWQARDPGTEQADVLLAVSRISWSLLLEAVDQKIYPPPTSLFDLGIERIQSSTSLVSFLSLQKLMLEFPSPPKASESEQVVPVPKRKNNPLLERPVPKVRIRLPLIVARVKCRTHSFNVDADVIFNASISAKGGAGPVVMTGEVSINATVDACPIDYSSVANPLVRLSGLHCFIQSNSSDQGGTLDLKLTTTGIIFHVVPDHMQAALSIMQTVHSNVVWAKHSSSSRRSSSFVEMSAGPASSNSNRVHISASLNSIVIETSEFRDSPPVLSLRFETPSVSIVGGGGEVTVILQCTFLEFLALAYQNPLASSVLPISDHLMSIESLSVRGDRSEVSVNSKSAAIQISPDVLQSLLPLASALPLAEFVEFRSSVAEQRERRRSIASREEQEEMERAAMVLGPRISIEVAQTVQIHLADLRSNREKEVCILSLVTSNVEIFMGNDKAIEPLSRLSVSLDSLQMTPMRFRPNIDHLGPVAASPFLSLSQVRLKQANLDANDFLLQWNPELHLQAIDLLCSLLATGISYRRLIPRMARQSPARPSSLGSQPVPPPAPPLPLGSERTFPKFTATVVSFTLRALIGQRAAMQATMDEFSFSTLPGPSVQFTNARYLVAPNHVDFRQLLVVPYLHLALRLEPRTIIGLKLSAKEPHWTLPYQFDFGAVLDQSATVFKSIGMTTVQQLRENGIIPPAKGLSRQGLPPKGKAEATDNADDDESFMPGDDDDDESSMSTPSTSRLKPPRFVLSVHAVIEKPIFDLMDNEFEVRLATAYRIRMDELAERAIREEMLSRRFHKLRRAGNLSEQAYEALLVELSRENTRVYIRRVREALELAPRYVHRMSSPVVQVELGIDVRRPRLKKKLRRLNKKVTRVFKPDFRYKFDIMVGLKIGLRTSQVTLQHRDLPNPWISVREANISMSCIIAEDFPKPESEIHWTVLASATRSIKGVRTSTGIKIYHDISLKAESFEYVMGPSYDWYQKAFVESFGLMPPENSYKHRLNWWDKMRFMFHGVIDLHVERLLWKITGTLNPYDVMTYLAISGERVRFRTSTNKLQLDAQLLEIGMSNMLPFFVSKSFRLVAGMQWEAMGDPDDHLLFPVPSYTGPFVVDASSETNTPWWRDPENLKEIDPDPFAPFRATKLHWSFELEVSPPDSTGTIVTLDNATFSRFIKFGKTFSFPEMWIQPPIIRPAHPGKFSKVISSVSFQLRSNNFKAAYWESRDVRDPVGFKVSIGVLDVKFGLRRRPAGKEGWKRSLERLSAEGIESLMFPAEDYTRFYEALRGSEASSDVRFPGTPFVMAPTLELSPHRSADGRVVQHFTVNGLRVTYTPPAAGLISSWQAAYEEWDNKGYAETLQDLQASQSQPSKQGTARTVSEHATQASAVDGEKFFDYHNGHVDFSLFVNDAQVKLVTIVPPGAALLVADNLELHIGSNPKKQRLIRVIWREYELYCSNRNDLWLEKSKPSDQLPRILTKCSMEFDIVNSDDETVMRGDAEAKGSLTIVAPVLLAHMNPIHFNILRAVFGKFFVAQTSMSEQHKELLATIQYKLQLAPESVGDVSALKNRVRDLGAEIKDLKSMIRDLEAEAMMSKKSPEFRRKRKNTVAEGAGADKRLSNIAAGARLIAALEKQSQKARVCEHCGEAFVLEVERVEVEDAVLHARCVVDYRTALAESASRVASGAASADGDSAQMSRTALLRQRLLQKQKTYQASSSLLNLLIEGQRKVKQGANALPTWKLSVRIEQVTWHLMEPQDTGILATAVKALSVHPVHAEDRMFCEIFLKFLTASILLREDDSGIVRMELNRVSILNHTPNTTNKYLHALQPLKAANWSERDVMIRVFAAMRSPVGGIQVYDHFEFNVTPLRVSLTGDLWQSIYDYIFYSPPVVKDTDRRLGAKVLTRDPLADELSLGRSYSDFYVTGNGDVYYAYDETDFVRMRIRAENNRMFVYWKLTDVALLLTFRKGLSFENLQLALHAKEYRTFAGSWGDLVGLLKNDVLKDVLGQTGGFIKHAFTPKSQRDTEDVNLRPKSRLLTRLDGLGRAAHNVVTFGKGGKERALDEERARVQQQLLRNETTLNESLFEQLDVLDEVIATDESKIVVEKQLEDLKAELLLGNLEKREQERQKLLKRKKKEEKETARRAQEQHESTVTPLPPRRFTTRVVSPRLKGSSQEDPLPVPESAPGNPASRPPASFDTNREKDAAQREKEEYAAALLVPSSAAGRRLTLFQSGRTTPEAQTTIVKRKGPSELDISFDGDLDTPPSNIRKLPIK